MENEYDDDDESADERIKATAIDLGKPFENPKDRERLVEYIKEADVIWGWDTETDNLSIFYGVDMLESIVKHQEGVPLALGCVKYRNSTDELEQLCGLIAAVKGSHCYGGEQAGPAAATERRKQKDEKFYSRYEALKSARQLIQLLKSYHEDGHVKFTELSIRFGEKDLVFTPDEYFAFALKGVQEAIDDATPDEFKGKAR
jgi:hypothetical protein